MPHEGRMDGAAFALPFPIYVSTYVFTYTNGLHTYSRSGCPELELAHCCKAGRRALTHTWPALLLIAKRCLFACLPACLSLWSSCAFHKEKNHAYSHRYTDTYTHTYIRTDVHTHMYTYMYTYVHIHVSTHIHAHVTTSDSISRCTLCRCSMNGTTPYRHKRDHQQSRAKL